jgi:hypothetical protein
MLHVDHDKKSKQRFSSGDEEDAVMIPGDKNPYSSGSELACTLE